MDIKVYSLTHIGLVRSKNQDNFYCEGITPGSENESFAKGSVFSMDKPLLFGVFDGMGGHLHGERAASIAVETCGQLFDNYGGGNPYGVLNEICRVSNQRICDEMEAVIKGRMGSTASMLLFEHGLAFICNLGDSPVFLIRGGTIKQISYEHTERRNYEQAFGDNYNYNKRRKFRLTQHLGILPGEAKLSPYNSQREIRCDDKFLICSDGLTDMVEKEEIASIVTNARSLENASRTLLERALENGGRDNITIILCEIGKQPTLNSSKKKRFPGILQRKPKTDNPKQKEQLTKQAPQEAQKPQAEQTVQAPQEAQKPQAEQTVQTPQEAQKPQAEQTVQAPQEVQKSQAEQTVQAPQEAQKPQTEQTKPAPQEPQAEQTRQEPQLPITQKVPQEPQSEQVKELQESLRKEKRKTIIAIAAALAVTAAAIVSVVLFTLFRQPKEQTPTETTQSASVQQTTEQAAFALSESEEGKASAVKDSAAKVMGDMEAELIKQAQSDAESTKPTEKDSKDKEKDKKETTEPTEKSGDNKEKNKTEATQPTEKSSDNKEKNKAEEANDGNGSDLRQWQL